MSISTIVIKVIKDIFISFICEKIIASIAWKLLEITSKGFTKLAKSTTNNLDDETAKALEETIAMAKNKYYGTKEQK